MTALAPSPGVASPAEAAPAEGTPFTAEAIDDFAAAEALWRELEATGTVSPYQRFDWQKAYADAMRGDRS
jgi:CelD/BcsL family acetyltransferase involved in cellulose biosynthesis